MHRLPLAQIFGFFISFVLISGSFLSCNPPSKNPHSGTEPRFTDQEHYLSLREKLADEDTLMSFESGITLNSLEQSVDRKLVRLRNDMIDNYLAQSFFPPSRYFYKSKDHIEQTGLFKLLGRMPKGGIMHLHSSALCDSWWIVNKAMETPNCYVYWGPDNDQYIKGQLHFYRQGQQPEGFVKTSQLQEQDPQSKNELYDLLTFDTDIGKDSVDIWQEFENIFQRLNGFTYYRDIYQPYHKAAFDSLLADGVQHVEIRARLNGGLYDLENPKNYYNSDSLVMALKEVMEEVKQEHPEFTLKLIYTSIRFGTKEMVLDELINAYHIRKKYPDLVVGFDLVANEDDGNTTLYFLENWLKMDSLNQAFGIDMPLYLHDGESDWSTLTNLYDAVLLNSRRIGHGFNLAHYPTLIEQVKQKNISIEISPLSNQILGYVSDLRMHPGQYFLANGVQCTISSDDPGVFAYNGLSYDYWSIFLAWELDLRSLKKLVMNSLEYSSLNDKEKQRAFERWESQWQKFIKYADGYLDELLAENLF